MGRGERCLKGGAGLEGGDGTGVHLSDTSTEQQNVLTDWARR